MSILAAYCVPHPPLILPQVGRGEEKRIAATIEAYRTVAKEIAQLAPDTILLTSPHLPMYQDYFHIAPGKAAKGDMSRFGAPGVHLEVPYDTAFVRELSLALAKVSFPGGTEGERDPELDHASFVPLSFILERYQDFRLVRIGLSGLDLTRHYELGQHLKAVADTLNRRCVFVASGDLSHRLMPDGPYGFHPSGPRYDEQIMSLLARADFGGILGMDPDLCEEAGECGQRSFAIMAGALDRTRVEARKLSYEGPFGVGYGVVSFHPQGPDESRAFLEIYRQQSQQEVQKARTNAHPLVQLALSVIRDRLEGHRAHRNPPADRSLPEAFAKERAGVFVSLKKHGRLRGCIGTIAPTTESIIEEVKRNAVEAAFFDPRFSPLEADELPDLVCSVDVLEPAEPISGLAELDPLTYGVIVTSGRRRGLLLPNLAGIDTAEEQVRIAKAKAGIGEDEPFTLERFKVVRYQ